ncbi:MAG: response regulator [Muribaculaceae bacterium]|nr:response regulator [Muribaculaceae bacterium]
MNRSRFSVIHICMIIAMMFISQSSYPAESIRFSHITTKDGLPDNEILDITRDSQGFMWFATANGVCRYDGHHVKVFQSNNGVPGALPTNLVSDIQEDAFGILWLFIGNTSYACYDPVKESFTYSDVVMNDLYGSEIIPTIVHVDCEGGLWVCSNDNHVHLFNREGNNVAHHDLGVSPIGTITGFSNSPDGSISAIGRTGAFVRYDIKSRTHSQVNTFICDQAGADRYFIYNDNDNDIWIYGTNKAWFFNSGTSRWSSLLTNESPFSLSGKQIRDIATDTKGRIWIAVDNGGIDIVDKYTGHVEYLRHSILDSSSLSQDNVHCLYADTDQGMWVGTFKRGVSFHQDGQFKFLSDNFYEFNGMENFNSDISTISENVAGNLLLGTNDYIIEVDRSTKHKTVKRVPSPDNSASVGNVIIGLTKGKDNVMWLSTYNMGLISYDGTGFNYYRLDSLNIDSPANKNIFSVATDPKGYLWIGTWGAGLYGLDPHSGRISAHHDPNNEYGNLEISTICVSREDGRLYMGTTYGIVVYNPTERRFERMMDSRKGDTRLTNHIVTHVFEDSRGIIWIATRGGLNIYDRRTDSFQTPVDNLRHKVIHGIVEDDNKNLWVTTTEGTYLLIVNNDPTTGNFSYACHKYTDSNTTNPQTLNPRAIFKHSSGKIITGGVNGIDIIDPSNINYNTVIPTVRFTGLQLFNKEVEIDSVYNGNKILTKALNHTDEIHLDYGQNVFSVSFSAMGYVHPERTEYIYKLDGFNSGWTKSRSNSLTYTNLAPGKYTLLVKAINSDGYESESTAALKIIINPPFWRSWIAYVIYALILCGVILIIRIYLRHNERQKIELMKIQQESKQKHELDEMKLRFFTNISHDLRTPLTLIIAPLEYVISRTTDGDLHEKLKISRNNALRLLEMVNQLLDFRKSDLGSHNLRASRGDIIATIKSVCDNFTEYSGYRHITLTFFSQISRLIMLYDEDKIVKIMMNLLSNAFKFTPEGGRVDVSIDILPSASGAESLEIKVADNGCGISDEHKRFIFDRFYQVPGNDNPAITGSGVGLNLAKEFVMLHNGTINVLDNIGKGTVFIITIPINHAEETGENHEMTESVKDEMTEGNDPEATVTTQPENDKPTILIVDDNDDFRLFMKDCLKNDFNVHDADNGTKAWEIIPELQPAIIISDVMMPGMDGNELCHLVKNDIRTSHILVILLTAKAAKEHELKGLESGADDYITKPFNLDILNRRIRNLLQKKLNSQKKSLDISPSKIDITPLDEKLMKKAIKYVEDNLSRSDLSVEELSSELGMSRVHLYKKMLSITGKTPIEFIRIIRLKRAAQLLAESQLSVSEITYQTGFNNLGLFRKYFKNEYGILPSEYQLKHGAKYDHNI